MSNKHKPPLFYRSFHLTIGAVGLLLPVFIWIADGRHSGSWPIRAWIIFIFPPLLGSYFFLFGLFASDEKINSKRIAAVPDNFLVAILAVPLYLVLSGFQRKKHVQSTHKKRDRAV
jgi:hypothetical protein